MAKTFLEFLTESSLSRIYSYVKEKRSFGALTAYRDAGNPKMRDVNIKNNQKLAAMIKNAGYGFFKVEGHYTEKDPETGKDRPVTEHSFVVVSQEIGTDSTLKSLLIKWGKTFDQDSILFKDGESENAILIGTNNTGYPGIGVEVSMGKWKPNKLGEYYSKMKGNKTFAFECINQPTWHMGMMALYNQYSQDLNE